MTESTPSSAFFESDEDVPVEAGNDKTEFSDDIEDDDENENEARDDRADGENLDAAVDIDDDVDVGVIVETEIDVLDDDAGTNRSYHHESDFFGPTDVATGRAKLELLKEERRLRELLSDDF